MILPNKLISFQDCILAKTVYILEKISDSDFSVIGLYEQVETHFDIVNIGLHFFLKNVRPYAASCSEA